MRRALEEAPGVELVAMEWDEHWADVVFSGDERAGIEELRARLMPAGAYCASWPKEAGA